MSSEADFSESDVSNVSTATTISVVEVKFKISSLTRGERIDDKWMIQKKIKKGGFGAVYKVAAVDEHDTSYAMKFVRIKNEETEQLVKMEIGLLYKLSKLSVCFPRFYSMGLLHGHRYFVMDLLGPSLAELQDNMPDEKFSLNTVLRVGLQLLDAIEVMHSSYFIHRDIKPSNTAIGVNEPRRIYLFDFGLARRFVQKDPETGDLVFRPERENAPFRGTYHYSSPFQHELKDACRRDDLWALMYTLIEFLTGVLPWDEESNRKKIAEMKQETPITELLKDCPLIFADLLKYLETLEFKSLPSYDLFRQVFMQLIEAQGLSTDEAFDWEVIDDQSDTQHATDASESVDYSGTYDSENRHSTPHTGDHDSAEFASLNSSTRSYSSIDHRSPVDRSRSSFSSDLSTSEYSETEASSSRSTTKFPTYEYSAFTSILNSPSTSLRSLTLSRSSNAIDPQEMDM